MDRATVTPSGRAPTRHSGETTPGNSDSALELPTHPLTDPGIFLVRSRDRFLPGYDPPARAPAGFLHGYQKVFKTPRVTLALLLLAARVALVGGWTGRLRPSERYGGWDVFLLAGGGAALLLGSVLTSAFVLRYLLPAVPLIVCGGVLAVGRLVTARGTA